MTVQHFETAAVYRETRGNTNLQPAESEERQGRGVLMPKPKFRNGAMRATLRRRPPKKNPCFRRGFQRRNEQTAAHPTRAARSEVRVEIKPGEEFPVISNPRRPASAETSRGSPPGPVATDSIQHRCAPFAPGGQRDPWRAAKDDATNCRVTALS